MASAAKITINSARGIAAINETNMAHLNMARRLISAAAKNNRKHHHEKTA